MVKKIKNFIPVFFLIPIFLFMSGCATLQQITETLVNLRRLQFKLERVSDFYLAGINISRKSSISDFNVLDGIRLLEAFRHRSFPAEFILFVQTVNPNDGSNGSTQTVSTLTSLECRLLIDGQPTINGNIDRPVEIPGTGQVTTIPIRLSMDLYQFFGENGYDRLLDLALAIGGVHGSTARLSLDAQPRVSTP